MDWYIRATGISRWHYGCVPLLLCRTLHRSLHRASIQRKASLDVRCRSCCMSLGRGAIKLALLHQCVAWHLAAITTDHGPKRLNSP